MPYQQVDSVLELEAEELLGLGLEDFFQLNDVFQLEDPQFTLSP